MIGSQQGVPPVASRWEQAHPGPARSRVNRVPVASSQRCGTGADPSGRGEFDDGLGIVRAGGGQSAADPARHAVAPESFEQILDWLLHGLEGRVRP